MITSNDLLDHPHFNQQKKNGEIKRENFLIRMLTLQKLKD
jgi:hypothetical protein